MIKYVKKLCWGSVLADALMLSGGDIITMSYGIHNQFTDYIGMILAFAGLLAMFQFVRKAENESHTDQYMHWVLKHHKIATPFFLCGCGLAFSIFGVIVMLCSIHM